MWLFKLKIQHLQPYFKCPVAPCGLPFPNWIGLKQNSSISTENRVMLCPQPREHVGMSGDFCYVVIVRGDGGGGTDRDDDDNDTGQVSVDSFLSSYRHVGSRDQTQVAGPV